MAPEILQSLTRGVTLARALAQNPTARKMVRGTAVALAFGAAAGMVAEAVRPRPGPGRLIDWDEVRLHTIERVGQRGLSPRERRQLAAQYARLAAEMRGPLLRTVGRSTQPAAIPPFEPLDRADWIDLNLEIVKETVGPALEIQARLPNNRLTDLGRAGMTRYVGALLAFLSQRVLGQFDPQILGHEPLDPRAEMGLYLVEPNLAEWESRAGLGGEDLRRWVILHEMTHAWQFGAHPWLRPYLNSTLREVLSLALDQESSAWRRVSRLVVGAPRQWAAIRRLQAAMTLVEGYGNLVMSVAGREVLTDWQQIEGAYRERSRSRSPLEVLFWKITGLDIKLQQYERGERFARAIHDAHGMRVLNRTWDGPDQLPRLDELDDPESWYRRVGRRARPKPVAKPAPATY